MGGRLSRSLLLAAALALGASSASGLDMAKIACRSFLASGRDNMSVIIMWLRGYHAGKRGVVQATDNAQMRAYGGRLGHYCKAHPDTRVIDASEEVLKEEDRGI